MSHGDPRKAALLILNELSKGHSNLDRLLDEQANGLFFQMPRRDRALANALIYGVLRWRGKLDWQISSFASRPLNSIKPEVLNILRIGLFQIFFMSRIPQSAAVNTSVEMAKEFASKRVAGFVNGLLRNFTRNPEPAALPDPSENQLQALAVAQSFPQWIINRWNNSWGMEETSRLCVALNKIPPVTVRTNTLITTRALLLDKLKPFADNAANTMFSPFGIALQGLHKPVNRLPGFREGLFQIQDEAAQIAALVLGPRPGEKVLDACAGLGGKTACIAQLMENRGILMAADSDKSKLESLKSEMQRLGICNVKTRCLNFETSVDSQDMEAFDRILIDAPCSGMGVIRRNPDIKWSVRKNEFQRHHQRQKRIIKNAAGFLKHGGILVYTVCSLEPEETDSVIGEFLKSAQDYELETIGNRAGDPEISAENNGSLRLFPHRHETDGFFMARIRRRA